MPAYSAPVREYKFLLREVLQLERYANLPSFADAPIDLVEQVLEEGAKFCEEVLQPLNEVGDRVGCTRAADGSVTTPPGFKEAYKQYCDAGWPTLSSDPAFGGQGMPHIVALAAELNMAMAEVYEVATFYHHFDVIKDGDPPPAITVRVCDSIACEMAGAHQLLTELPAALGPGVRVLHAPCVGRCETAPVAVVGQNPVPHASTEKVATLVRANAATARKQCRPWP